MNGADPQRWSQVAREWSALWGGFAVPVWDAILAAAAAGPGSAVLDVGCGAGDFLAYAAARGATVAGADPADGMLAYARGVLPHADLRAGDAARLPWPADRFDLVTAVNALQFAEDTLAALAELTRVTRPGGFVAVANWAQASRNDLDVLERAVEGDDLPPDGELRLPGGLSSLLAEGGLTVVADGIVDLPWSAADDDTLVRGVLLGEDPDTVAATAPLVLAAAAPFRTPGGGYRLVNAFRYAVATKTQNG